MEVDTALWTPRIPDKYSRYAPELRRVDGYDAWFIDGKLARKAAAADLSAGKGRENYNPTGARYEGTPGTGTPAQRLEEQAQERLFNTILLRRCLSILHSTISVGWCYGSFKLFPPSRFLSFISNL